MNAHQLLPNVRASRVNKNEKLPLAQSVVHSFVTLLQVGFISFVSNKLRDLPGLLWGHNWFWRSNCNWLCHWEFPAAPIDRHAKVHHRMCVPKNLRHQRCFPRKCDCTEFCASNKLVWDGSPVIIHWAPSADIHCRCWLTAGLCNGRFIQRLCSFWQWIKIKAKVMTWERVYGRHHLLLNIKGSWASVCDRLSSEWNNYIIIKGLSMCRVFDRATVNLLPPLTSEPFRTEILCIIIHGAIPPGAWNTHTKRNMLHWHSLIVLHPNMTCHWNLSDEEHVQIQMEKALNRLNQTSCVAINTFCTG